MAGPSDTISFEQHGLDRRTINGRLSGSRNVTMLTLIGAPCGTYGEDCRHPTNTRIAQMMETAKFGPFNATGLRPAVATLKAIMADIEAEKPAIHSSLTTAGMLCCRLVRGSATAISNHSWGTAIDLKIDGRLDARGDNRTQKGLLEIAPIFNRHKFFWGAAFPTQDCMHFEASEQLIHQWAAEGEFGAVPKADVIGEITLGDRSAEVEELQATLNIALGLDVDIDGIFGKDTRAAVMEFQREHGLTIDGVVGKDTLMALKEAGMR